MHEVLVPRSQLGERGRVGPERGPGSAVASSGSGTLCTLLSFVMGQARSAHEVEASVVVAVVDGVEVVVGAPVPAELT